MCDRITIVRGTTPTHTYTFDKDIRTAKAVLITYKQDGKEVLSLGKDDFDIGEDGTSAEYTFTQEQTNLFAEGVVYLQGRAMMYNDTVVASDWLTLTVADVLDDTVLGV